MESDTTSQDMDNLITKTADNGDFTELLGFFCV